MFKIGDFVETNHRIFPHGLIVAVEPESMFPYRIARVYVRNSGEVSIYEAEEMKNNPPFAAEELRPFNVWAPYRILLYNNHDVLQPNSPLFESEAEAQAYTNKTPMHCFMVDHTPTFKHRVEDRNGYIVLERSA